MWFLTHSLHHHKKINHALHVMLTGTRIHTTYNRFCSSFFCPLISLTISKVPFLLQHYHIYII